MYLFTETNIFEKREIQLWTLLNLNLTGG